MNYKLSVSIVLALSAWQAEASAQTIYRCGDSYSQKPCPGGTVVQADDARSANQRSQTTEAAQRDAKAADAMEKARLKEEAKPAQVHITPEKTAATASDAKKPTAKTKSKKPQDFTAVSPRKPDAKKKKPTKKTAA